MGRITGGSVEFERKAKVGEYEHKFCRVVCTYSTDEGETDTSVIDAAGKLAHDKVHQLLGLAGTAAAATEPPAKPRGRQPKAVEAPAPAAPAADPAAIPEPANPTQPVSAQPSAPAASTTPAASSPAADPAGMSDDVLTAAPAGPTLTEEDTVKAVTQHNQKITNPQAIKALLAEYVTHPKGVRDVPANMRQQFIDRLHKIVHETKPEDVKGIK